MGVSNGSQAVLLVEDDNLEVSFLVNAFQRAQSPFTIIAVRDGVEAIKYLSGQDEYAERTRYPAPSLVLLDLSILRLDGPEVLRWMGQQEQKMPPTIVLSGSVRESDRQLVTELGAKEYRLKTSDLRALVEWIRSLEAKVAGWGG